MPQVGAFFLGAYGIGASTAVGATLAWGSGAAFAATTLGSIAVNMLTSVALSALSIAIQGKPKVEVAGLRHDQTLTGGTNPDSFGLGKFATNGSYVAPFMSHGKSGKTPNSKLNYIVELSSLKGHALEGMFINGERVEILEDDPDPEYGKRIGGRFLGYAWVKFYDGTQTAADPMLVAKYPPPHVRPWTSDMVGHGICYAIVTFQYKRDVYQSWPTVRFELSGAPLYDPRKDSSVEGGMGTHRWDNPSTWETTNNATLISYNILRGIPMLDGEIWGGGIAAEDLPLSNWIPAINKADALVDDGDGGLEPQYRAGIEVMIDDEPWSVLEEFLTASNSSLAETGGVWTITSGEPDLPVLSIDDGMLMADSVDDFKPFPSLDSIYNSIEGTYPDPESVWESRDAPPIRNPDWEASDGGRRLTASMAFNAVPYPTQVQRLMSAFIRDHRRMRVHVITLPPLAFPISALDTITWDSQINGYDSKLFIVRSAEREIQTGRVVLVIREWDPEDYDPPSGIVRPESPSTDPMLPVAQAVPLWAAAGWTFKDESGEDRRSGIRASWDPEGAEDARGIRFAIRLGGETTSGSETAIYDAEKGFAEIELLPATFYEIRARFVVDRPTEWSSWISVLTPDVRLGPSDVTDEMASWLYAIKDWVDNGSGSLSGAINQVADDIAAEVATRQEELAMTAQKWREHRDEIRQLASSIVELGSLGHLAREEIRRSLTVQLGEMGADYSERILLLIDQQSVTASKVETLEAVDGDLSARIEQVDVARVEGENSLAALIAQISVGSADAFDTSVIWFWDEDLEGWTGTPSPPVISDGWIRQGVASVIVSPSGLGNNNSTYKQFRARVRKVGSPSWAGRIWWLDVGETTWIAGKRFDIPEPIWDANEATVTMNIPWTGNTDKIRLELSSVVTTDASNYVEIDWAGIGRPAPSASRADLLAERSARISGDSAITSQMSDLSSRITDTEQGLDGQATALQGLETRVEDAEDGLSVEAGRVDVLTSRINDPNTGLGGLASAIEELSTFVEAGELSQSQQASFIRSLSTAIKMLSVEGVESNSLGMLEIKKVREAVATAVQILDSRVDATDDGLNAISQFVTQLDVKIEGKASSGALQTLQTEVNQQGSTITSQGSAITSLNTTLNNPATGLNSKASASALNSLATIVEESGTTIEALSEAVIKLGIMTPEGVAETVMRMAAETTPSGVLARIGLKALVGNSSDDTRVAAMFLEALSGGESRVAVEADRFVVMTGASTRQPVFEVVGGQVYIRSARIKEASIDTLQLAGQAVTLPVRMVADDIVHVTSPTDWVWIGRVSINRTGLATDFKVSFALDGYGSGSVQVGIFRWSSAADGDGVLVSQIDTVTGDRGRQIQVGYNSVDPDLNSGNTTYSLRARLADPARSAGWTAPCRIFRRYFEARQTKR